MEHGITLITTLAAGFGFALIFGFVAEKLKVPALVGYLLAGIILSPSTPGFAADLNVASQLSEIGVMLLMFGVGLHFSTSDLLKVKYIAVPGAIAQMAIATVLGMIVSHFWGWTWGQSFVFGMCLSCASTVVLLKALESQGILESHDGRIAVGWLVVEDIMTVLILVLLPPLASMLGGTVAEPVADAAPLWQIVLETLARVFFFIALMLVIGKRVLPWILWQVAKTGSRELFTLCVLAVAIGIAYGASIVFDVSFALGAFFAGMVMRESKYSHRAAIESLPLRDAFSVIFFVGVGMMFDPMILIEQPLHLLAVLFIIMVGKSLVSFFLVMLFRYPLHTSLTTSAALAQIGEFSFILAGLGLSLGLLPKEGMSLILAGAIFSIALNPFAFAVIPFFRGKLKKHWKYARVLDAREDPNSVMPDSAEKEFLTGHVVVIGMETMGRLVLDELVSRKMSVVVVDKDSGLVTDLREKKIKAIAGDATDPASLIQAHVQDAAMLVLTTTDDIVQRKIIETVKVLNPNVEVVLLSRSQEESDHAIADGLGKVFYTKRIVSMELVRYVMDRFGRKEEEAKIEEEEAAEQSAETSK